MRARIYPQLSYLLLVAIASTFFSRLASLIPATRTAVFVLYGIAILLCIASGFVDEMLADKLKISEATVWVIAIASSICLIIGALVGVLHV